jgi:tartrate-resistant acid phosphatase type 5
MAQPFSRRNFLKIGAIGLGGLALPRWPDIQAVEAPLVGGETARVAVIGDYGVDTSEERAVANLVKNLLKPEIIVTTGDNNYGSSSELDRNIGQYYHEYIGNYKGSYGTGAASNRFFPTIGNHDWLESGGYRSHLNYFSLPGNERYYDFVHGPIHWFILSSEENEVDGITIDSKQGKLMSERMKASTAPWKLAVIHDPPYSSGSGMNDDTEWPFKELGIHAVFSGDSHNYERLSVKGFPYFVNGAGGQGIGGWAKVLSSSIYRNSKDNGALLIEADEQKINFKFYTVVNGGTVVDRLTLQKPAPPALNIVRSPN